MGRVTSEQLSRWGCVTSEQQTRWDVVPMSGGQAGRLVCLRKWITHQELHPGSWSGIYYSSGCYILLSGLGYITVLIAAAYQAVLKYLNEVEWEWHTHITAWTLVCYFWDLDCDIIVGLETILLLVSCFWQKQALLYALIEKKLLRYIMVFTVCMSVAYLVHVQILRCK
jgi:hypothetical protein